MTILSNLKLHISVLFFLSISFWTSSYSSILILLNALRRQYFSLFLFLSHPNILRVSPGSHRFQICFLSLQLRHSSLLPVTILVIYNASLSYNLIGSSTTRIPHTAYRIVISLRLLLVGLRVSYILLFLSRVTWCNCSRLRVRSRNCKKAQWRDGWRTRSHTLLTTGGS